MQVYNCLFAATKKALKSIVGINLRNQWLPTSFIALNRWTTFFGTLQIRTSIFFINHRLYQNWRETSDTFSEVWLTWIVISPPFYWWMRACIEQSNWFIVFACLRWRMYNNLIMFTPVEERKCFLSRIWVVALYICTSTRISRIHNFLYLQLLIRLGNILSKATHFISVFVFGLNNCTY